jgi:ABC-type branched-subunit amino acid transport system permease subunit
MDYTMYEALFFVIGLIIGGMAGVLTMCVIQINRNEKEDTHE